jgi:hypothetical protein
MGQHNKDNGGVNSEWIYYKCKGTPKKFGGGGGHARVLGPLDVAIDQKFTMPHAGKKPVGTGNRVILDKVTMIDKYTFELDKELLHGGNVRIMT